MYNIKFRRNTKIACQIALIVSNVNLTIFEDVKSALVISIEEFQGRKQCEL